MKRLILFIVLVILIGGCASAHKPHGILDPKKPIPCPGKPKCR